MKVTSGRSGASLGRGAAVGLMVAWVGSACLAAPVLQPATSTAIADPKLSGASIDIAYSLGPVGEPALVEVLVYSGDRPVASVFSGPVTGSATPVTHSWDGRDSQGNWLDPGPYVVRIRAVQDGSPNPAVLSYGLAIVRLGITAIQAWGPQADTEWQMVYFMKGASYGFYGTPEIHEYLNVAEAGEVSDLDLDDGSPRPPAPLHTATASPPLEAGSYEDDRYNYPLCYRMGVQPRFAVTFGASATGAQGHPVGCGYPVAGYEIRALASDPAGSWTTSTTAISPGAKVVFDGPALPSRVTRTDRTVVWRWQYRELPQGAWADIPGTLSTAHRFYTILGKPVWATNASGTQYRGPWVEAAEWFHTWQQALGIPGANQEQVVATLIRGYFGGSENLTQPIEGVKYDCPIVGGDGGASRYYSSGSTQLSRLFNNHANGPYVNCSDVASTSAAMLGMLGVSNVRMFYLGSMSLKAIWGIGTPGYTMNLWGSSHSFTYHHIVTRDGGAHVSDACLSVDEDGSPATLPGTPGYNCDRPWSGVDGYNFLSSFNSVSTRVDPLPRLY